VGNRRKDHKPTEMEDIWSLLVVPFAESHFIKTPLIMLVEGDYSDFDRRYKSDSDAELMSHRKWLETTYSIPARSRANPVTDPKLLLTEQLEFTTQNAMWDFSLQTCSRTLFGGH